MRRLGQSVERKPADLGHLFGFTNRNRIWIHADTVIERNPMSFYTCMLSENFSESQKIELKNVSAIFFFYLAAKCGLQIFTDVHSAASRVPGPMFVATIVRSLMKKVLPVAVMTKEADSYPDVVDAFAHGFSIVMTHRKHKGAGFRPRLCVLL